MNPANTLPSVTPLPLRLQRTHTGRVTQMRVALSEWTKLRSIRSTRYTLLAGVGLTIVFAIVPFAAVAWRYSA